METVNEIIIIGGGGHARVVADCLFSRQDPVKGFCALEKSSVLTLPYLGVFNKDKYAQEKLVAAIGDNLTRKKIGEELELGRFINVVHSSAIVSPFVTMGVGCMILHGTIIQPMTRLGNHVIINTGSCVDHDCTIGDYVHVAPGAVLGGEVKVGEGALIGAGASILRGVKIGAWAAVGLGAVVIKDIPDYAVAVGNPAHVKSFRKP